MSASCGYFLDSSVSHGVIIELALNYKPKVGDVSLDVPAHNPYV
jgi:hypothetical protein